MEYRNQDVQRMTTHAQRHNAVSVQRLKKIGRPRPVELDDNPVRQIAPMDVRWAMSSDLHQIERRREHATQPSVAGPGSSHEQVPQTRTHRYFVAPCGVFFVCSK
jgi:hypothetical protein